MLFAIPGDLATPTGGYEYARQILAALPYLRHLPLPGSFPFPTPADLVITQRLLKTTMPILIDGLALGALPPAMLDAIAPPIIALVHHPLFLETGLTPIQQDSLRQSEQAALAKTTHIIATSASTAELLTATFGIQPSRLTVAEPGTNAPEPRAEPPDPTKIRLLSVGAVVPRKAYHHLIQALQDLTDLPWTLTIAGALDRDPTTAQSLRQTIAPLANRITLTGAIPTQSLRQLYARSDIFITTSLHEGYGMAAAEALAHGLPIIASDAGALATTIPNAAALKYPAGDISALRDCLHRMMTNPETRTACAQAARKAGQNLPTWQTTAQRIHAVLTQVSSLPNRP